MLRSTDGVGGGFCVEKGERRVGVGKVGGGEVHHRIHAWLECWFRCPLQEDTPKTFHPKSNQHYSKKKERKNDFLLTLFRI